MADDNPLALDVEKRTTRGRVCPRCGGKIIPSNRAVYQQGKIPPDRFRYGRVRDVVMRRLENGASPLVKPSIKNCRLPMANCRFKH